MIYKCPICQKDFGAGKLRQPGGIGGGSYCPYCGGRVYVSFAYGGIVASNFLACSYWHVSAIPRHFDNRIRNRNHPNLDSTFPFSQCNVGSLQAAYSSKSGKNAQRDVTSHFSSGYTTATPLGTFSTNTNNGNRRPQKYLGRSGLPFVPAFLNALLSINYGVPRPRQKSKSGATCLQERG